MENFPATLFASCLFDQRIRQHQDCVNLSELVLFSHEILNCIISLF